MPDSTPASALGKALRPDVSAGRAIRAPIDAHHQQLAESPVYPVSTRPPSCPFRARYEPDIGFTIAKCRPATGLDRRRPLPGANDWCFQLLRDFAGRLKAKAHAQRTASGHRRKITPLGIQKRRRNSTPTRFLLPSK